MQAAKMNARGLGARGDAGERLSGEEEMEGLLLANPMAQDDLAIAGLGHGDNIPPLVRPVSAGSGHRSALHNSRPKNPSVLRFLVRGGRKRAPSAAEDSSDSEQELQHLAKSPSAADHSEAMERFGKSPSPSNSRTLRSDSGFSSEKDIHRDLSSPVEHIYDVAGGVSPLSPPPPHTALAGVQALEMLHNQLQILVKADGLDGEVVDVQEEVIVGLRQQVDGLQEELHCMAQSEHALQVSLAEAEQSAVECQAKLHHCVQRNKYMEHCYSTLVAKYQQLTLRFRELERLQQRQAIFNEMDRAASYQAACKKTGSLHRVCSSREFDRPGPFASWADLHNSGQAPPPPPLPPPVTPPSASLSHTETSV